MVYLVRGDWEWAEEAVRASGLRLTNRQLLVSEELEGDITLALSQRPEGAGRQVFLQRRSFIIESRTTIMSPYEDYPFW